MTQELVIGVLLTGLVGLIWAMTISLLWNDRSTPRASEVQAPGNQATHADATTKRTIAA